MSNIHRSTFELTQRGVDGQHLDPWEQAELEAHRSICWKCQMDARFYARLQLEAGQRWPIQTSQLPAVEQISAAINARIAKRRKWQVAFYPVQLATWIALAVVLIAAFHWIFTNLRPLPAGEGSPTAVSPAPTERPEPTPAEDRQEVDKIPVEPLFTGESVQIGGWSPGGEYLLFGSTEIGEDPQSDRRFTVLNFLQAESGQVCRAESYLGLLADLGSRSTWLPDGRLLFIAPRGEVQLFTPCQEMVEISDRLPEAMISIPRQGTPGELILLRGSSRYWLLSPEDLAARPVENLEVSSVEIERYAWSLSAERLGIVQLEPGNESQNSTLYIVDAATGQVERTIELGFGSEYGAPMIEWMQEETLLIWSGTAEGPLLVDISQEEPHFTPIMAELLGLDQEYPIDISMMGGSPDRNSGNFYLVTRANTPDDQSIYLYQSETGAVEQLASDRHAFLIFPGGEVMLAYRWEDEPNDNDEYELIWADAPERGTQRLLVRGHAPRNYPMLFPRRLPGSDTLIFSSSQGVSLVTIPDGEVVSFWQLLGAETSPDVSAYPDPQARWLAAVAGLINPEGEEGRGSAALFLIPLQP